MDKIKDRQSDDKCKISNCKNYHGCNKKQIKGILDKENVKCINYKSYFSK